MKFHRITSATVCTLLVAGTTVDAKIRGSVDEDKVNVAIGESFKTEQSFVFNDVTHTLKSDDVDGTLCDKNSRSMSGYMDISGSDYDKNGEDKHLFYWFFEKRSNSLIPSKHNDPDNVNMNNEKEIVDEEESSIPFIVWLTGGPGCSSSLALLTENGPCSVSEDGETIKPNLYSWTETAHMLWLDQPAGVGFSYGETTVKNEKMVSEDVYYFLQAFFKSHPKYQNNPLFIVGESYGGHYAPAVAHKVFTENKSVKDGLLHLNLSGLAVGNGSTKPEIQYQSYPEMAYHNSHGIKVVNQSTYLQMKKEAAPCAHLIHECNTDEGSLDSFVCQTANAQCNKKLMGPYDATGLNPYDIRKKCGDHPLCYDFSNVEKWLNKEHTKQSLHVSKKANKWQTCNDRVNSQFTVDEMKDYSGFVADLLNAGIPALIYAGDVDFICNYLGNKAWTTKLEWNHGDEFKAALDRPWKINHDDAKPVGLARSAKGLTFMQVFDAGHMVPTDQPVVALHLIQNFIKGGTF